MITRTDGTERPDMGETFMKVAALFAERSTCPDGARHGCVITKDGILLAEGYGSPASGVRPCEQCWLRKKYAETGVKDWTVCPAVHAEANAIANAARKGISLDGASAWVTRMPCEPCQRLMTNAGLKDAYFKIDGAVTKWPFYLARMILRTGSVQNWREMPLIHP